MSTTTHDLPLFACIARSSDPITSHIAAAEVAPKLTACQCIFVAALKAIGEPSTASEVARRAVEMDSNSNCETYRKRANECLSRGAIAEYGRRRCGVTGKMATTYVIPTQEAVA